eukprot:550833_1
MTNEAPAIDRLGIPFYNWRANDIHSERDPHSTIFPNGCGIGSTWSKQDLRKVGTIIGIEARSIHNTMVHNGNRVGFNNDGGSITPESPNINLVRDPRWGRAQEVYSEDPALTGHLAAEFVKGLQYGNGSNNKYLLVGAQCKHFGVYDLENIPVNRLEYNAVVDAIDFAETYTPAFYECVNKGNVMQIMCSYNSVNGIPACGNEYMLTEVLKKKWKFEGLVVSDYDAWEWIYSTQHYCNSSMCALITGLNAGCDMEGGGTNAIKLIPQALNDGNITIEQVYNSLKRIWRVRIKLGVFDPPTYVSYNNLYNDSKVEGDKHLQYAREIVSKSICLYKNNNNVLPLNKENIKGLIFVGPQGISTDLLLGNYYTYDDKGVLTLVEALRNELDTVKTNVNCTQLNNIFYEGNELNYTQIMTYTAKECANTCFQNDLCNYWTWIPIPNNPPPQGNMGTNCNMLTNIFKKTTKNGAYSGECLDKNLLIKNTKVRYINGCYNPKCETNTFFESTLNLLKNMNKNGTLSHVIIGLGLDQTIESEGQNDKGVGFDRSYIELPGNQTNMVSLVYNYTSQYNIPIICLLIHGGTLALENAYNECDSILDLHYPGSQASLGVMDVLFGRYNPAGRASVTSYLSTNQLPAMDVQNEYPSNVSNGITYRYFNGSVLFEFGFGISYTQFNYSNLELNITKIENNKQYEYILNDGCGVIKVSFNVQNIGKYVGDEVTQLYIKQINVNGKVPNIRLGDFERIENINVSEMKKVELILTPRYRSIVNINKTVNWWDPIIEIQQGLIQIYVGGGQPDKPIKNYLKTTVFVNQSVSFDTCSEQN